MVYYKSLFHFFCKKSIYKPHFLNLMLWAKPRTFVSSLTEQCFRSYFCIFLNYHFIKKTIKS